MKQLQVSSLLQNNMFMLANMQDHSYVHQEHLRGGREKPQQCCVHVGCLYHQGAVRAHTSLTNALCVVSKLLPL